MQDSPGSNLTELIHAAGGGNQAAADQLLECIYPALRRMATGFMAHERPNHTLQPTALVHEVFLRLFGQRETEFTDRTHFFRAAARNMRQVLTDHARKRQAMKRTGNNAYGPIEIPTETDQDFEALLVLDDLLTQLEAVDKRAAEGVQLTFFCGMSHAETAEALGITPRTAARDWAFARAWLYDAVRRPNNHGER